MQITLLHIAAVEHLVFSSSWQNQSPPDRRRRGVFLKEMLLISQHLKYTAPVSERTDSVEVLDVKEYRWLSIDDPN